jgi:hypothetical protein
MVTGILSFRIVEQSHCTTCQFTYCRCKNHATTHSNIYSIIHTFLCLRNSRQRNVILVLIIPRQRRVKVKEDDAAAFVEMGAEVDWRGAITRSYERRIVLCRKLPMHLMILSQRIIAS